MMPEFYRFWYVREGGGALKVDGREVEMKPGQLYLIPPNTFQSFAAEPHVTVSMYWCHFRASIGDAEMFDLLKLPLYVVPDQEERMVLLFEQLIEAYRSLRLTKELRTRAKLLEILAVFLEHGGINEATVREIEPFEKLDAVLKYIEEHLSERIAVEDLARLVYLHPNYFIGYFRNLMGHAPAQYVTMRRLERAKLLLELREELSITDIAQQVGMQGHYLSRMFRQYTGLTPSRYRQIYCDGAKGISHDDDEEDEEGSEDA
ncbi:AraC family transcriptional regulator [Paenibacillus sacheonensis]|uniref:AraC family transcriptional regulator n=2 Tax=Paenibacillus sacheonensis TaxID=742054 RepID=A0A7X4YT47_9BACL|nr:AraC family transcriptional regulator [Paenibacillus sacheonensis]